MRSYTMFGLVLAALAACGCGAREARFPVRAPMVRDGDLASVTVACHPEPTRKDPAHVSCAPARYASSDYWDLADNVLFRPLSDALGVVNGAEAVDVNSLDEVPDSSWFTNRIDTIGPAELRRGACAPEQLLDPDHAADGSWVIDKGKEGGSVFGFRVVVPGKGKYLIKTESEPAQPELESAASVIGTAVLHAAGYNASCEQVLWVRSSIFEVTSGLVVRTGFRPAVVLDRKKLDELLATSPRRGELARIGASAWIGGHTLGAYRFVGTRDDDPNDVVPHEDRRELRAMRLLAAWIGRYDAREANTLDTWIADDPRVPDSSPGHVVHYVLDTSETLGARWEWTSFSKRLGHSYVVDYGDTLLDIATLGMRSNSWDRARSHPVFGFFTVDGFSPEHWKPEYPNPAFGRMTERDGAWMARILARFTPEMVRTLAEMGSFTDRSNTTYLAAVLQGRLDRVLERYLLRLSPIANLRIEGDALCGVDLAERRGTRPADRFRYTARLDDGVDLAVEKRAAGELCVALPHRGEMRIRIDDGVAKGALVAHVHDRGPQQGFQLVGVERPEP